MCKHHMEGEEWVQAYTCVALFRRTCYLCLSETIHSALCNLLSKKATAF